MPEEVKGLSTFDSSFNFLFNYNILKENICKCTYSSIKFSLTEQMDVTSTQTKKWNLTSTSEAPSCPF